MHVTNVETDGLATSTGPLMHRMVQTYHRDMLPYVDLTIDEVYDLIKNLPFRSDPPDAETLMRPRYTMNMQGTGGDCDDKAIALASYAVLRGIRYRFVAVRRKDRNVLHHVFPQLYIRDNWITFDPTYSFNRPGREREEYAQRVVI